MMPKGCSLSGIRLYFRQVPDSLHNKPQALPLHHMTSPFADKNAPLLKDNQALAQYKSHLRLCHL